MEIIAADEVRQGKETIRYSPPNHLAKCDTNAIAGKRWTVLQNDFSQRF